MNTTSAEEQLDQTWQALLQKSPELKSSLRIYPQIYRDKNWYLLVDPLSRKQLLVNNFSYQFLTRLDGRTPLTDIISALAPDIECEREDVERLLTTLISMEMVQGDLALPAEERHRRNQSQDKGKRWQRLLRPLAIQVPVFDPDRLLTALLPVAQKVFTRWGALCWLIVVALALIATLEHWHAIGIHFESRFIDPTNLLTLWFLYPLIKAVHELSHGLTAKLWGAEVHEMGFIVLVLMPVPYVDASSTLAFASRRHRMAVAAAGIVAEILLASIAIIIWSQSDPGLLRDLMFNITVIGGVSTILFNGNPLLRFDGYYVFADALDIPNLGTRSTRQLGFLFKKYLFGLNQATPQNARGETAWLVTYGLASGLYRLFISITIALYVAGQFFVIGILLAMWFVFYQVLRPFTQSMIRLIPEALAQDKTPRLAGVLIVTTLALAIGLFWVPASRTTVVNGVLVPPEQADVRVKTAGFVTAAPHANSESVAAGDLLFELADDELAFREDELVARLDELNAQYGAAFAVARSQAEGLKQEISNAEAELAELRQDIGQLKIHSVAGGTFSSVDAGDLTGRFVNQGRLLGYVSQPDDWVLRVMIPQASIDLIRSNTPAITAVSVSDPRRVIQAVWESEIPQATMNLPARALGTMGGGDIPVDARDPNGLRLLTPMFQAEVRLQYEGSAMFVGQRFLVRFLHDTEPVGFRLWHSVRRLFLNRLHL